MQILAVDIGTSTQSILLFDDVHPSLKLTLPSPTALVAHAIQAATNRGDSLYLTGVTMGGGPCTWAVRNHIQAGYRVCATLDVAHTFADDPDMVGETGITILEKGERPSGTVRLELRDFDLSAIQRAFMAVGIRANPDAIALAVFDHGFAPPGVSDRTSRFEYVAKHVRAQPTLTALAYMRPDIPAETLRLKAVASSTPPTVPVMVMDTAFAALLGIHQDPEIRRRESALLISLGTMHTLAVHVYEDRIAGLFEHHTANLSPDTLDDLLTALANGTLTTSTIEGHHGHGALILAPRPDPVEFLAVTGPRCGLMYQSRFRPYPAAPYGDGAAPGCWGLIHAYGMLRPEAASRIEAALTRID